MIACTIAVAAVEGWWLSSSVSSIRRMIRTIAKARRGVPAPGAAQTRFEGVSV